MTSDTGAGPAGAGTPPPPLLASGSEWRGILVLAGPTRIDGRVRGEILAEDVIWIGPTGEIEADLEAETVLVAGRVSGNIRARARIELAATAEVRGSLDAPCLVLAEGSVVNGPCRTGPPPDGARRGAVEDPAAP